MHPLKTTVASQPVYSKFADDPDFGELLQMFLDTIPDKQRELRDDFDSGRIEDLCTKAHQLKGAGGGYGFEGLTAAAAELERACRARNSEWMSQALQQLLDYMGRIAV